MSAPAPQRVPHKPTRADKNHPGIIFLVLLVIVTIGGSFAALVLPRYLQLSLPQLQVGEVSPQDFLAPYPLTYISGIRTSEQRDAAAGAVTPIYTPADTSIARSQLTRLRAALAYISSIRADVYASPDQKETDLAALEDIKLNQPTAQKIFGLSETRWQIVQQEAIVVLEEVMRNTIRTDRLDETRRSVPSLVSLSLPEDQAAIVAELVTAFVIPNSLYNESQTESAREQARAGVSPISRTLITGETIVQRGWVLTSADLEALQEFGLMQPANRWQETVAEASLTILAVFFVFLFLRRDSKLTRDTRGLTVIAILFLIFLFGGRLILPGHTVYPYLFPFSAFSLTVATLFGSTPALLFTLPLAILVPYNFSNPLTLTLYYLLAGFFGVLTLGSARRLSSFLWAFMVITLAETLVITAFRLPEISMDWIGMATLAGAAVLNAGISAGLTVLLQFFIAQFLGLTTALQLIEISRPDHPLLQNILRQAPGTYQHSLQVANLAEQAAEKIGADALLTRVGALYHDAGKSQDPFYFIENQLPDSTNPHNTLEPSISASIILRHISDGLEMARKYHLPRRVQNFITEHHGTMLARYQYYKAVEAAGGDESKVDQVQYRYPGPRPQSRETAILMLADGSEARVRAERPKDETALRATIKSVIDNRLASDQLIDTDLTLHDLDVITDSFATTLRGIYHPRIEYPKL